MYPLISVIVPVYNVENYLRKCLESIINQTYKNLEIILIDDGSTDNSGKICDEYAAKDNRIKLIHKPNGGISDARNAGLEIAKGEYIGFVDSDDYIAEDMYEFLYNFAVKNNLDVAMCGSKHVFNGKVIPDNEFKMAIFEKQDEMIKNLFSAIYGGGISVWNKLFKKSCIKDIKFEYGKTCEDAFYILNWIERANRFGRRGETKYFYVQREGSITHNKYYSPQILDLIEAYIKNLEIIKKKYPGALKVAEYKLYWAYSNILWQIYSCKDYKDNKEKINKIIKFLHKNLFNLLKNDQVTFKHKIKYIAININPYIYFKIRKYV